MRNSTFDQDRDTTVSYTHLGETIAQIEKIAGEYIYGIDVDSLEQVVVRQLIQKGKTLALAESCTGGLIAQKITSVPGASGCFEYGLVSYSNRIKAEQLGVNPQLIANHGVVSPQAVSYTHLDVYKRQPSGCRRR